MTGKNYYAEVYLKIPKYILEQAVGPAEMRVLRKYVKQRLACVLLVTDTKEKAVIVGGANVKDMPSDIREDPRVWSGILSGESLHIVLYDKISIDASTKLDSAGYHTSITDSLRKGMFDTGINLVKFENELKIQW